MPVAAKKTVAPLKDLYDIGEIPPLGHVAEGRNLANVVEVFKRGHGSLGGNRHRMVSLRPVIGPFITV